MPPYAAAFSMPQGFSLGRPFKPLSRAISSIGAASLSSAGFIPQSLQQQRLQLFEPKPGLLPLLRFDLASTSLN